MITLKILLQTNTNKSEFVKEYKSIDSFNEWKQTRLKTNCKYIKYSVKEQGEIMYSKPFTEYGTNRNTTKFSTNKAGYFKPNTSDSYAQKQSRNNHLALSGNDLVNLSMTPQKHKKLMKWINSNVPITPYEIKTIKSMFKYDKLTLGQYNFIKQIQDTVSRRVKV